MNSASKIVRLIELNQNYEFTDNSNFHIEQGNTNNLSDLLGSASYTTNKFSTNYDFRYDFNEDFLKSQSLGLNNETILGAVAMSYVDSRSKSNDIITTDTESLNYSFISKKFANFSKIELKGNYDLKENDNKEYSIGYSYFDECFGINLDLDRKFYTDNDLKPKDVLTIMFSFKNVGSYASTNLAVSETDKQDIRWELFDINNELFN